MSPTKVQEPIGTTFDAQRKVIADTELPQARPLGRPGMEVACRDFRRLSRPDTLWSQVKGGNSVILAARRPITNDSIDFVTVSDLTAAISPSAAAAPAGFAHERPARKFAFLSFRPFANDFRRYLIGALSGAGCACAHVLLTRKAMEIRTGPNFEQATPVADLGELTRRLREFLGDSAGGRGVIVNSAGNSAPDVILRLWGGLRDQLWIYDVFDELRYDARGLKRLQWWLTDRAYFSTASACCLLSAELKPRYVSGFHLNNASHLMPSKPPRAFDDRIVVTASFDRRTDFALLDAVAEAAPDVTIDLHGAVYDNEQSTVSAMDRLTATHGNVRYHGRFDMDRIGDILGDYSVGLVPYRIASEMTRFINPDKLFHYLCAGLEIIASPIPAMKSFRPYIYEAADAPAFLSALHRIRTGERRNPGDLSKSLNWHVRSQEFLGMVERVAVAGGRQT